MHKTMNLNRNVHTIYELVKFIAAGIFHINEKCRTLFMRVPFSVDARARTDKSIIGHWIEFGEAFLLPLNSRITKCLMEKPTCTAHMPCTKHMCVRCTDSAGSTEYFMWVAVHIARSHTDNVDRRLLCTRDAYTHCYLVWIKSKFLFIVPSVEDGPFAAVFSDPALDCAPAKTKPDTFNFCEPMKHSYISAADSEDFGDGGHFFWCKPVRGKKLQSHTIDDCVVRSWRDVVKMWKIELKVSRLRFFIDLLRYCELWMQTECRAICASSEFQSFSTLPKNIEQKCRRTHFKIGCSVRKECVNWIVWRKKCQN